MDITTYSGKSGTENPSVDSKCPAAIYAAGDAIFRDLVLIGIRSKRRADELNGKLAKLKTAYKKEAAADMAAIIKLRKQLSNYVVAQSKYFKRNRLHKTPYGAYGLRKSTELQVTDLKAVIAFSDEQKLDLYQTIRVSEADNAAIRAAIDEFGAVPGARLVSIDVLRCKPSPEVPGKDVYKEDV